MGDQRSGTYSQRGKPRSNMVKHTTVALHQAIHPTVVSDSRASSRHCIQLGELRHILLRGSHLDAEMGMLDPQL